MFARGLKTYVLYLEDECDGRPMTGIGEDDLCSDKNTVSSLLLKI